MPLFFARLTANRPDFMATMTADEQATMRAHVGFLQQQLEAGALVVAGPVLASDGPFGMAVFEVESLDAMKALLATDPARAVGRYDVAPMAPGTVRRAPRPG